MERFSISSAAGGDKGLHQAGDDVVDMPGDGDAWGDCGGGAQASTSRVTVARGRGRRDHAGSIFGGDALGIAAAERVVGERAGSALGVVDYGDLEQRAVGQNGLGGLADEGDIIDHLRGDPPTDVADDHRVAEAEVEEVRGIHARIEAGDHEQGQVGEDDGTVVAAGGGEGAVAFKHGLDVGGARLAGAVSSNPFARPIPGAGGGRRR